jgi:multisubunit Na+/H+ antiporter MnhC subunit
MMMGPTVSFAQTETIIVILIVLGLIVFMVRKPKLVFSLIGLGLLLAGLFYLILIISGSGSEQKKKMIHEEEKQLDTER